MARKKTDIKNVAYDDVKKLYYVTLYYGTNENGKPIKEVKTCKTKTEAKKILVDFESAKLNDNVAKPKNDTVSDWLDYWLENVVKLNNAETTYAGYKYIVNHIKPVLGNIPLQKLRSTDIQEYLALKQTEIPDNRDEPLSSNTAKKHYTLLKTALNVAKLQEIIKKNPIEGVSPPKLIKPKIEFYNVNQLKNLLILVEGNIIEAAIYLAGFLGLRREEISGLKWKNVDFEKRIITITSVTVIVEREVINKDITKNETSTRKLSISDALYVELQRIKNAQIEQNRFLGKNEDELVNEFVVSNWDGTQINPSYLSSLVYKFVKEHNLPHISLRGLRHSVASILNEAGVTLFDISKMLGHSSPDVTGRVYVEVFDRANQKATDIVGDILKK